MSYELDLVVNLDKLGLAHAPGSECKCSGKAHELTVTVRLEDHELHMDGECEPPLSAEGSLQALHEQAHPAGTAYFENCREPACREIRESASL
jgi:hypothetical protein